MSIPRYLTGDILFYQFIWLSIIIKKLYFGVSNIPLLKHGRPLIFLLQKLIVMKKTLLLLLLSGSLLMAQNSQAQFLKKLKDKAKDAVAKKVDQNNTLP